MIIDDGAKKPVFLNLSNHPSDEWGKEQRNAAEQFGKIIDVPFPAVDAEADTDEICRIAEETVDGLKQFQGATVMVQGEFTLTYHLVSLFKERGYRTVASCSRREAAVTLQEDGSSRKESVFRFIRFREY